MGDQQEKVFGECVGSAADQYRGRHWMFTFNNVDHEDESDAWQPATWFGDKRPDYCVWQLEKGESTETYHLQGYVTFPERVSLAFLKRWLVGHWERCDGNHKRCIDYCKKDETRVDGPWDYGTVPQFASTQGRRHDIIQLRDAVIDGASDRDIVIDDQLVGAFARHPTFVQTTRLAFGLGRNFQTYCIILWGPAGTGKTTKAYDICRELGYRVFPLPQKQDNDANHWWDGYEDQEAVVINEASGSTFKADFLCQLLDRHPLVVPRKNGHVSFRSKLIVFTSNRDPRGWYSSETLIRNEGLSRRFRDPITQIFHLTEKINVVEERPQSLINVVAGLVRDDVVLGFVPEDLSFSYRAAGTDPVGGFLQSTNGLFRGGSTCMETM